MSRPRSAGFRRRHYQHPHQLWADLRRLMALRGPRRVAPALRERLMLVVTGVSRCRYCIAFHTTVAQLSGLAAPEVALILGGSTKEAPAAEIPALVYARQWAEAAGQPLPELTAQLTTIYGPAQAQAIQRVLLLIWIGNLAGNTWDALLFRLSGGRLGGDPPPAVRPDNQPEGYL